MVWRLKSVSEDSVDWYTHTCSVILFTFLGFVTLLVPMAQTPDFSPKYKATCWCPAQFEASQVDHANAICSGALNSQLEGKRLGRVTVHVMRSGDIDQVPDQSTMSPLIGKPDSDRGAKPTWFLHLKTPFVLFLLAICLRLPRILWSILSCCTQSINVDQTLQSAKLGDSLETDRRKQLHSDLMQAFWGSARGRENRLTCFYMAMKVLMLIVVIAELVIVSSHILPEMQENKHDKTPQELTGSSDAAVLEDNVIIAQCRYPIYRLSTVVNYELQCFFHLSKPTSSPEMLSTVYHLVLSTLIVLVVANAISTLAWVTSLGLQSSRNQLSLHKSAPLDSVLLIHMARTNLSVGVAAGLADALLANCAGDHEEMQQ